MWGPCLMGFRWFTTPKASMLDGSMVESVYKQVCNIGGSHTLYG